MQRLVMYLNCAALIVYGNIVFSASLQEKITRISACTSISIMVVRALLTTSIYAPFNIILFPYFTVMAVATLRLQLPLHSVHA